MKTISIAILATIAITWVCHDFHSQALGSVMLTFSRLPPIPVTNEIPLPPFADDPAWRELSVHPGSPL
jgi:hypothetical protein